MFKSIKIHCMHLALALTLKRSACAAVLICMVMVSSAAAHRVGDEVVLADNVVAKIGSRVLGTVYAGSAFTVKQSNGKWLWIEELPLNTRSGWIDGSDAVPLRESVPVLNREIGKRPNVPYLYANRGLAFERMGKPEAAIASYNRAIQLNPNHAMSYNNRGVVFQRMGNFTAAVADYERALTLDPQHPLAQGNLNIVRQLISSQTIPEAPIAPAES